MTNVLIFIHQMKVKNSPECASSHSGSISVANTNRVSYFLCPEHIVVTDDGRNIDSVFLSIFLIFIHAGAVIKPAHTCDR